MYPVLFHIGHVAVPTHDVFVALGLLVATIWFAHETRVQGVHDGRIWVIVLGALLFGGVFSRVGALWHYAADPSRGTVVEMLRYGGRSVLGGLAGAYVGVLVMKRIVGYRASTGDLFAPAVALGIGVGRIGCLLTEQLGTRTSLPWGIAVPTGARAIPGCPQCVPGVHMHPSFAYEILFQLAMFGVLVSLRRRPHHPGDLFKLYIVSYALFRFLVEFVRGNPALWHGLSGSQIFLLCTLPLLVARFGREWARRSGVDAVEHLA